MFDITKELRAKAIGLHRVYNLEIAKAFNSEQKLFLIAEGTAY